MKEQQIKLFVENGQWYVEYGGGSSLKYDHYDDAVFAMGLLAKEVLKVFGAPVKTLVIKDNLKDQKESYLYPQGYLRLRELLNFKNIYQNLK